MQADEIIQQKEWFELSGEEKSTIQELAASEQEFNLLKKMLQISAEEIVDAPLVESHVKDELHALVASRKKSVQRYWYAAAAAIVLFIAGAIFLQKEKHTDPPLVKTNVPQYINSPVVVKAGDTLIFAPDNIVEPKKKNNDTIAVAKILPQPKLQPDQSVHQVDNLQVYASVSKTVSEEKELLALVTEIY